MSLLDPLERARTGLQQLTILLAAPAPEPRTLFETSWRDFVFAEVWTRAGLDRRSRYLIAMTGATCASESTETLEGYIRGALTLGEMILAELREAALHLAAYGGWSRGAVLDTAITRVADALGLPPVTYPPIRSGPWDPDVRRAAGQSAFQGVALIPGPPAISAFFESMFDFVFAELWTRPQLDYRARRWICLVCVADSASSVAIRSQTYTMMASGNATLEEMHEFVLQYAIHGSWPKASVMHGTVMEMGDRIAKGLPPP